jgi:ribosomal protein S18 acetylase RimI-like enzyme
MRVHQTGDRGDVYGFVVDPPLQGRGIGRDVLRRVCRQLREQGATLVGLEVEAQNDNAIRLYTSLGFEPVTTEDYWAIHP